MSARPARILHVISTLGIGGAETMLKEIATAKAALADETMVVSLLPKGIHTVGLRAAGIAVIELDFKGPRLPASFFKLVRLIRTFRPTIVQGWMYHGDLAALLALKLSGRRAQTKLVWGIRCSNMDLDRYSMSLRLVVRACAALSRLPDLTIANSKVGLDTHLALGYRPRCSLIVHNGIDVERFKPDGAARAAVRAELGVGPRAFVLAHVARVDPMKDHANMLAAIAALGDVHAMFVGPGTERLPGADNIHRMGARTDIARLFAGADAVVLSSAFGEGFSNALAEGMACGLPAVATDVGEAKVIVGDTGFVVSPSDPTALAAALAALARESAEARSARGARARARIVENFSLSRAVQRFAGAYSGLAATEAAR